MPLLIGLTPSSKIEITNPNGEFGFKNNNQIKKDIQTSMSNDRLITHTGVNKKDFTLDFVSKKQSDFNTLYQFANTPQFFYVEFTIGVTAIVSGYFYLEIKEVDEDLISNDVLKNFKVEFLEK